MARIFITGSTDGLGQLTANALMEQGHEVVMHARNRQRALDAIRKSPIRESVYFYGDLNNIEETKQLAYELNQTGRFDAVIHNAGVYETSSKEIFSVNTLAPYILTCLMQKPKRLIYLSSGMHMHGRPKFDDFRPASTRITYSDSKLHVMMLCMAVSRKWKDVYTNTVDPGWVPTKMGGPNAPDDLQKGFETQAWLAVSNDEQAKVSGKYFFHQKIKPHHSDADDETIQQTFLDLCYMITGVTFP